MEHREITIILCCPYRGFYPVIPGDVQRVNRAHARLAHGIVSVVFLQTRAPFHCPGVELPRVIEQVACLPVLVRRVHPRLRQVVERQREVRPVGSHAIQQFFNECLVLVTGCYQPDLLPHSVKPVILVQFPVGMQCGLGGLNPGIRAFGQQWHKRFGQACQVPQADRRLIVVGIAPVAVNRTVDLVVCIVVHERTGAVIDGLAGNRHVVGVHYPVDEAKLHPLRDQCGLPVNDCFQQGKVRVCMVAACRVVVFDDVVGESGDGRQVAARGKELECADAHEAGCEAGDHPAGQQLLPGDFLASGDSGQGARGRYAQFCHGLTDQVFAQDRAQRGTAVTVARETGLAGTFQVDVTQRTVRGFNLPQQQCTAIAQLRVEVAELVAGIGHGHGLGTVWHDVTRVNGRTVVCGKAGVCQPKFITQCVVENNQFRIRDRHRRGPGVEVLAKPDVPVVEGCRFQSFAHSLGRLTYCLPFPVPGKRSPDRVIDPGNRGQIREVQGEGWSVEA